MREINTPLQCMLIEAQWKFGKPFGGIRMVEIEAPNGFVMGYWMMFTGIISKVVSARRPVNVELALLGTILDPIVAHVNDLRALLLTEFVGNFVGSAVVCLPGYGWLGMAHCCENVGQNFGFSAIDE